MKNPKLLKGVRMRKDLEGYLLYYPRNNIFLLNEVAYDILSLCDESNTIEDISNYLSEKYEIDKNKALEDVNYFIKKFETLIQYE